MAIRRWGDAQKAEPEVYRGTALPHRLTFTTRGLDAVLPWLLQFAGEVAVISPRTLREQAATAATHLTLTHAHTTSELIPLLGDPDDDETQFGSCTLDEVKRGVAQSVNVALRNPPPKKKLNPRPRMLLQGS